MNEWPPRQIVSQIVRVYGEADRELESQRASVVVHAPPELLPPAHANSPQYHCFCLVFAEHDRMALFMDVDASCLVRETEGFETLAEADNAARDWATDPEPVAFREIPGIYQAALVSFIRGSVQSDPTWFAWAPSLTKDTEMTPIRDYPPKVDQEGEAWMLAPTKKIRALFDKRGW